MQLLRLKPSWAGYSVFYATVAEADRENVDQDSFVVIPDANRTTLLDLVRLTTKVLYIVARHRPRVVVSTGAAPGCIGVFFGRMFGAYTIWIDSIANAWELSLSGKLAGRFVHQWLTQWPELSGPDGPFFHGSIL